MQPFKPIQKKIMKVIMLTSGTVLLMTCTAFFIYEYITAHDIMKRQLSTLGEITAANTTAAMAFDNPGEAFETLSALQAEKQIEVACLFDTSGRLFAVYPAGAPIPQTIRNSGYAFREGHLEGFQPVVQNGGRLGTLYLRSNMQSMYRRFELYGLIAFVFIVISFAFAYLLSRRLQRSISSPILELAQTASQVSEGDYTLRAIKRDRDEIGTLTDAFNHMLERIETQNHEITELNQNLEAKVAQRTSELEEAYLTLKQQNAFVETIIDASVDSIAVLDTELRFLVVNRHAEELYKFDREQLLGRRIDEAFPGVSKSPMMQDLQRALGGETVRNAVYKSSVIDRYFDNFYVPLKDKDHKVYLILLIAHDITESILARQKLENLNKELEKSNQDLEQFAYVASHDLQEPLRKIQTFAELTARNLHNPEIMKRYLDKVHASARRMTELIKAVLNYSRLSRGDQPFEMVDLNHVLQSLRADLELLIAEKGARIEAAPLPPVRGIPLQLNQLFLNLLTNALKFTERQPEVNISAEEVRGADLPFESAQAEATYIRISIADNGIGFKQQYADKIFSIFQRLHSDSTYAGTGIGLALCKKIVENHRGYITVNSAPGAGTTFFIYLPK